MSVVELESFLPYRLSRAAAVASRRLSRIYRAEFGLTIPEWRTLATLGQFGQRTATQIGQHSSMHKTKVSRAVSALQKRRWLKRTSDDHDRRVEHLELTAAGRSAYRRLAPKMLAFEEDLVERLDSADRKALLRGLAALEDVLLGPRKEDTSGKT